MLKNEIAKPERAARPDDGKGKDMPEGKPKPGSQVVAVIWNDRCVGKLYERVAECAPPLTGVYAQSWHGQVLGRQVDARSLNDAFAECRKIYASKGLRHVKMVKDDNYPVIMPAFED